MAILDEICTKIRNGQLEFSQHATDQSIIRDISVQEVREAIEDSEVIEDYPNDRYGPELLDFWLHAVKETTTHLV